ncbi:MAG: ABC transporter permease [Halanaeroarchaeum sp.]
MKLRPFLRKEWYQTRRNVGVILVVLILLPGAAALGTAAFQKTLPEDIPVGIAPASEEVSEHEMRLVQAGTSVYAAPVRFESPAAARAALVREKVYLAFVIPPDIMESGADVTITQISDQRMAPFQDPANYTQAVLQWRLNDKLPSDVTIEQERIGTKLTLSEYMVPTALMILVVLYSFIVFPFELRRERDVYDRVDLHDDVGGAVLAKILFHGAMLIVPLTVFQLVGFAFGYRIQHFDPSTMAIVGLTFVYMAATSGSIMFFARLRRAGIFANVGVMALVLSFSGFVFPVGFFSTIRKEITTVTPTYHSMRIARSTMLKDATLQMFGESLVALLGFTVVMILTMRWGINAYRRRR